MLIPTLGVRIISNTTEMNDFMKQIPSSEGDGGSAGEDIPAFCGA
jgi:hypothetical protein